MGALKENDLKKIKKLVEEEFPHDPALQHVHIARKIIAKGCQNFSLTTSCELQFKSKPI
jgi:hypothetical protein